MRTHDDVTRRTFLATAACGVVAASGLLSGATSAEAASLPVGSAPLPVTAPWFPSRLHTFVWRNWPLVPVARLAAVLGASAAQVEQVAGSLGLPAQPPVTDEQWRRSQLSAIKRNWHLLPYDQLLQLLGVTADELAYTLREDDFLYHKLGQLKPRCEPLHWAEPSAAEAARAAEIAALVRREFPDRPLTGRDPLFSFVRTLSAPLPAVKQAPGPLRLGYSYFALYGDPLLDPSLDPYPDGYLARLAASGVNAVWLQGVLGRLAVLPWAHETGLEQRRTALRDLVARAARHGIQVFLYLNEPRALPLDSPVFRDHPDWRGVPEGGFAAVCTSAPAVRQALTDAVADLGRAVPALGGCFTISYSENLTNCWSHGRGHDCPQCRSRRPAEVIAEVNGAFKAGLDAAGHGQRLLVWDWAWPDDWALEAIEKLPAGVELMCVSEWSLPIQRGGVKSTVGEYSLSSIGPGPRALRHWAAARARGLRVAAKMQCGCSWELSAVPWVPAVDNLARHAAAVRAAGVEDIMLGWTLGGHPSPNLEAVAEPDLERLAARRYGPAAAAAVATFWRACSTAYREFPYHIGVVYNAPLQLGPANPLWLQPTGYHATMVGFPYDDLDRWRSIYPAEVFASQLEQVAAGFQAAADALGDVAPEERLCGEAAALHFGAVAHQARFVLARQAGDRAAMRRWAAAEAQSAKRLWALQSRDTRLGFEASNQYYYVPTDLVEKVVNCAWVAAAP